MEQWFIKLLLMFMLYYLQNMNAIKVAQYACTWMPVAVILELESWHMNHGAPFSTELHALEWLDVYCSWLFLQVEQWRNWKVTFKLGKIFGVLNISTGYGEDCLSFMHLHKQYQSLGLETKTSTENYPKSGQVSMSADDNHIEEICSVTNEDHSDCPWSFQRNTHR